MAALDCADGSSYWTSFAAEFALFEGSSAAAPTPNILQTQELLQAASLPERLWIR